MIWDPCFIIFKQFMFNTLHHILSRYFYTLLLLAVPVGALHAQQSERNGIVDYSAHSEGFGFVFLVTDYQLVATDSAAFRIVAPACNSHSHEAGMPMLPQYSQLIVIPEGAEATVQVSQEQWSHEPLPAEAKIEAYAGARPKESDWRPALSDAGYRHGDESYQEPLVSLTPIGSLRGNQIARLTLTPFSYHPDRQELGVCRAVTVDIQFHSRQRRSKSYSNPLQGDIPYGYLVVAPSRYRDGLQPLVQWKRQQGYRVEEFYFDNLDRSQIRAELEQRYHDATPMHPAPLFVLLVGDVDDILPFIAKHRVSGMASHLTDLYFGEYTGDYLPEAMVGRLSVNDTTELRHVVEKTLAYEQFLLPDSSYLSRSLLVAGTELRDPAPVVTNGQVNYLKQLFLQHDAGHDTLCYYNPQSDSLADEIYTQMQTGVGWVSYTAHCLAWGWQHPMLGIDRIDTLAESGRLFVAINNCCRSNEIFGDCFGEHLLRRPHGAAVGAIGATNETLWEEDYYWNVGAQESLTLHPLYDSGSTGAYDHLLHTHQEGYGQQAFTLGQMLWAGNWAVSESGSPHDAFYWEIYSVLGDPSLMPYVGIPETQQLQVECPHVGDNTLSIHGDAHARVAATRNDTLLGVCTLDGDGNGVLVCAHPILDSLRITSTAQFHRPAIQQLAAIPCSSSRIVATEVQLHNTHGEPLTQLTLCDSALLTFTLRNVGNAPSGSGQLDLAADGSLTTGAPHFDLAPLTPSQDTVVSTWICPLQENSHGTVDLTATLTHDSAQWSMPLRYDLLHPELEIVSAELLLEDSLVHTVAPATAYTFRLTLANHGNGTAKDVSVTRCSDSETLLLGDIGRRDSAVCQFLLTTPDIRQPLTVDLLLQHRADSSLYRYTFFPDSTSALAIPEETPRFACHPNPATEKLFFSGFEEPTHVVIYDCFGQKREDFFAQKGETIQYSALSLRCGCYSVLFQDSRHRVVKKIIIVR